MWYQPTYVNDDSMTTISANTIQNATTKRRKVHRAQPTIARKIIAFQELITLDWRFPTQPCSHGESKKNLKEHLSN